MNGYASKNDQKITFFIVSAVIIATIGFAIHWFMPRGDVAHIEHGIYTITANVARDEASQTKGLGGVETLGINEGLLMVYDHPGIHTIWMKDMKIPIDVVWIDKDNKVIHIEKNMTPESFPSKYSSSDPSLYVLELGSGAVDRLNIRVGGELNIPENV